MRLVSLLILPLLVSGCLLGGDLIGDEFDLEPGDRITLEPTPEAAPTLGDNEFGGTCLPTDTEVPTPALVATGGPNQIHVVHHGVLSSDAPAWVVYGDVRDGQVIDMTYEDSGVGDPTCLWELHYTITNLAPGTWTVRALGEEAQATVQSE